MPPTKAPGTRASIPPFPVVAPASAAVPKPIHIRAPIPEKEIAGAAKPEQTPAFKLGVTITLVVVGLALCVALFFGWRYFSAGKSPKVAAPTLTTPAKPAVAAPSAVTLTSPAKSTPIPTPAAVDATIPVAQPATEPVQVGTAASVAEEPVKLDLDHPAPSASPDPGKTEPATFSTTPSSTATTLAPGVTTKMGVSTSNSGASPEFRAFIANAKISGVFQGANTRAFINGRVTRIGEVVDGRLGITFDSIDTTKKQIVFKDASGAVVTRKY